VGNGNGIGVGVAVIIVDDGIGMFADDSLAGVDGSLGSRVTFCVCEHRGSM